MYKVITVLSNARETIETMLNAAAENGYRIIYCYNADTRLFVILGKSEVLKRGRPAKQSSNEEEEATLGS